MSYSQFKELSKIASIKGLTLAEYDALYKECEGNFEKMRERLNAIGNKGE